MYKLKKVKKAYDYEINKIYYGYLLRPCLAIEEHNCNTCKAIAKRFRIAVFRNGCPYYPRVDPPAGDCWQLWKNDFPISLTFENIDDLVFWLDREYVFTSSAYLNMRDFIERLKDDVHPPSDNTHTYLSLKGKPSYKFPDPNNERIFYIRDSKKRPVITCVKIIGSDGLTKAIGIAICSDKDNPDKKKGIRIARVRACVAYHSKKTSMKINRGDALRILQLCNAHFHYKSYYEEDLILKLILKDS